jgi:hypothetical protein
MAKLRSLLGRLVPGVDARAVHCGEYYCYQETTVIGPGRSCFTTWCGVACTGNFTVVSHYCQ